MIRMANARGTRFPVGRLLGIWFFLWGASIVAGEDFAFIHISDTHFNPQHADQAAPTPLRGAETLAWLRAAVIQPQEAPTIGFRSPVPAFGIVTGDVFEYGVIDTTEEQLERAFGELPFTMHLTTGNHDNTWGAIYDLMRRRHGGVNYSFDYAGCRFICISSSSPQEPVPSIDAGTRAWLAADLAKLAPGTPVFIAKHHPIDSPELAQPTERDTLIDMLRDHNVALLLYGHGHSIGHRNFDGIDGVMGGSTFGPRAGYAVIAAVEGELIATYRRHQTEEAPGGPEWREVFRKPLTRVAPQRLFDLTQPKEDAALDGAFEIVLTARDGPAAFEEVTAAINGEPLPLEPVEDASDAPRSEARFRLPVPELPPGRHLLTIRARGTDGTADLRTRIVRFGDPASLRWRVEFPTAIKAPPLPLGNIVIVAGIDGAVRALDRATGRTRWIYETGGEIIGAPAQVGDSTIVFGSGDGHVYALDPAGGLRWKTRAAAPVYGWPLVRDGTVYIGDNSGRMHALDADDGSVRWTYERARFAIESRPAWLDERIIFGAWDGYLHAVSAATGELDWRALGPKSSEGGAARYYSPADCGPAVAGGRLFVCDRGYELGTYAADGTPGERVASVVSGVAELPDRSGVVTRTLDDRFVRYDASGKILWEAKAPAGRFPIPPTIHGERVYVCSNWGLLSVIDAADGKVLWNYQATPGFYVMAPVSVDDGGVCYVAGMDGSVTALADPR